jgi:hypothetical protein
MRLPAFRRPGLASYRAKPPPDRRRGTKTAAIVRRNISVALHHNLAYIAVIAPEPMGQGR